MKIQSSLTLASRMWLCAAAVTILILLTTTGAAAKTDTILFSITGGADGAFPRGGVTLDALGNLYGTSQYANQNGTCCGAVWEISPNGGTWMLRAYVTVASHSSGAETHRENDLAHPPP